MPQSKVLDKYTLIEELGEATKNVLRQVLPFIVAGVIGMTIVLAYRGYPGLAGFAYISAGLCFCLYVWRIHGRGLPLVPVMAVQHFMVYGVPIFNGNEMTQDYSRSLVNGAGWETFVFLLTMGAVWSFAMQSMQPSRGMAHRITAFDKESLGNLSKVGVGLVIGSATYSFLDFLGTTDIMFNFLPNGTWSILSAIISSASMAGFFLLSMMVGTGEASAAVKATLAVGLMVTVGLALTSMLLYTLLGVISAVCLGFLWSAGRIPWKSLVVIMAIVGFLQLGKADMRERYHFTDDSDETVNPRPTTLASLPSFYGDWATISMENLLESGKRSDSNELKKHASLSDRIDNLQNLLYVMREVEIDKVSPLGGGTYWIIPALLIPRILWPEKPRTHEGQVMLNVYYGRQTAEESIGTYIAWGLLPEAYGNFGPLFGSIFLGAVLGLFFAWVESFTALKPLLSLEGMCAFSLLLGMATSFEMVASVLVTSQFQAMIVTSLACIPFVQKLPVEARPEPDEE